MELAGGMLVAVTSTRASPPGARVRQSWRGPRGVAEGPHGGGQEEGGFQPRLRRPTPLEAGAEDRGQCALTVAEWVQVTVPVMRGKRRLGISAVRRPTL